MDKDEQRALKWLAEAAAQKLADAEYLLATAYDRGLYGVPKDEATAAKWLRFAARQGHAEASYALGLAYAEGRGVEKDAAQAYGWMLEAARRGHAQANAFVRRVLEKTPPIGSARSEPAPREAAPGDEASK